MAYMLAFLLGLLVVAAPHGAEAKGKRPVDSVEVSSQIKEKGKDWTKPLRATISRELETMDWSGVPAREHVVLLTSLEHFKTSANGQSVRIECVVTIAIRGARSGNIRAILRGRANADADSSLTDKTQQEVLEAAVRGAVHGLPTALSQST